MRLPVESGETRMRAIESTDRPSIDRSVSPGAGPSEIKGFHQTDYNITGESEKEATQKRSNPISDLIFGILNVRDARRSSRRPTCTRGRTRTRLRARARRNEKVEIQKTTSTNGQRSGRRAVSRFEIFLPRLTRSPHRSAVSPGGTIKNLALPT